MLATRRNLMAAVAVLPLSACPVPLHAATAIDAEWDRRCAAYRTAYRRMLASMATFNERERAFQAAGGFSEPEPCAPKLTENAIRMLAAECLSGVKPTQWERQLAAHNDDMDAWRLRRNAAEAEVIGDTEDAMTAAEGDATDAFIAMRDYPAPTLAALAFKADAMAERYGEQLEASETLALIADIRRLAGKEA